MRTTVTLDPDVIAAIEQVRQERSLGLSAAVNELIRRGLAARGPRRPFRQQTHSVRLELDVTDVAEAIELLEGPAYR
jgi:hypothetical protein